MAASRLARLSLGALSFAMLTGCLIDDPPPYAEPKRTPPRLDYHRAWPPLDQVIVAKTPDLIPFSIPVASEDAGEELRTQLFIDDRITNYGRLPPSTLDDTERKVSFSYRVEMRRGYCHTFKIRVGHASNLPEGEGPPLDTVDMAEAYWLAYLDLPSDQTTPIENCFVLTEPPRP
jgi:hypothetical protein